ncbi:hypothetical protein JD844_019373 [Phrynosoma platyrhinos]|uniref:Transglutaminase-like domain-containing protein n=1 Tax=Phrynosoma platyrhinos TaxID=52577 RepID=A0ABQ7SPW5_PHRPL|nr:hypothetical protein JD844_019373 [Phrynosoma platyrhinos]
MFIFPPPDARIGRYHLTMEASTEGQGSSYDLGEFILLFNPWCPVNKQVNCNDDQGILFGRWDNQYDDGVSPMAWAGSVDILQRWQKFGCQPVRYGQCWVFAAVACTVLRALGIPTRVVTNYNSAHDTNGNLIIEQYLDQDGKLQQGNRELIWNYHCWVESWMGRPDLPEGYDGWQVLDPTPQEKSESVYCCGPSPVKAVKEGDLQLKYDVRFVFAEVNADVAYLMLQKDLSRRRTTYATVVGKNISTKSVGRDTKEDITHHYKYQEEKTVPLRILYEKYGPCLTQDNMIKVMALLMDHDTQEIVLGVRNIYVKNPDIKVRVRTNLELLASGEPVQPVLDPDRKAERSRILESPVGPGEEAKARVDFAPRQSGLRKLVVDFESDKLKGVKGYRNVIIAPLPK